MHKKQKTVPHGLALPHNYSKSSAYLLQKDCMTNTLTDLMYSIQLAVVLNPFDSDTRYSNPPMNESFVIGYKTKGSQDHFLDLLEKETYCKHNPGILRITESVSPITATRIFVSGSHSVTTLSAATARTYPSAEKAAAVIGFFLHITSIAFTCYLDHNMVAQICYSFAGKKHEQREFLFKQVL